MLIVSGIYNLEVCLINCESDLEAWYCGKDLMWVMRQTQFEFWLYHLAPRLWTNLPL